MRVCSLASDKSRRQHNRQTHAPLRSAPAECESACTACSPLKSLAPNGAGDVQGQQKCQGKGECGPGGRAVTSAPASAPRIEGFVLFSAKISGFH